MKSYIIDNDGYFIKIDIPLENEHYTRVPMTIGYYKPKFNKETQEWIEGATEEEIDEMKRQEEENRSPQEPSKVEILEKKVTALEESQIVQDFLIDDLVFEVIPTLEQQISVGNTAQQQEVSVLLNRLIKQGAGGMPGYLARRIIDGRDYAAVFKTNAYKQYQDEVDTILELEGRGDLIKRMI